MDCQANKANTHHGFTLIELLLAMAIAVILAAIAFPSYGNYREKLRVNQAIRDILTIDSEIQRCFTVNFNFPDSLAQLTGNIPLQDPWGNPYQYLNIAQITTIRGEKDKEHYEGKVRKDHNLHPLNTDFDLYSMGKDGDSQAPLTANASKEDIIRANNGGFIDLASKY